MAVQTHRRCHRLMPDGPAISSDSNNLLASLDDTRKIDDKIGYGQERYEFKTR